MVVRVKSQVMVVQLEVAVTRILVLLIELHFAKKHVLLPLHHPTEVKSMDYIHDPFFLHSCRSFHFTYPLTSR